MSGDPMRQIMWLLLAMALSFVLFAAWPGLDLAVTGAFHNPVTGFANVDEGWPNTIRLAIWRMSEGLLALAIAALIAGFFAQGQILGVSSRIWGFIALLYLLGPGLLVDGILKRLWGRARPADVTQFGGSLTFTPPSELSGQCHRNCSFVAGEVSGAVALAVCLLLLLAILGASLSAKGRRIATVAILGLPLIAAGQRIAAGRHFLSDAIFAVLFTLLVAVLLRKWVLPGQRN